MKNLFPWYSTGGGVLSVVVACALNALLLAFYVAVVAVVWRVVA